VELRTAQSEQQHIFAWAHTDSDFRPMARHLGLIEAPMMP